MSTGLVSPLQARISHCWKQTMNLIKQASRHTQHEIDRATVRKPANTPRSSK